MLSSLLFALAFANPVGQNLVPARDSDESHDRRMTPVVGVVRIAAPAVVYIQSSGERQTRGRDIFGRIFLYPERFSGTGSGVVIRPEGFIITNYHVVRDAKQIVVSFDKEYDENEYKATLVSFERDEDLALLKIQGQRKFPTIPLGHSNDLMKGETVVAIGNPYGQTLTVSQGIISGLHRNVPIPQPEGGVLEFPDLIQTDAAINAGNSGGPLLNLNGELIGINSAMNVQAQNIGFAIPVDRVRSVLESQLLSPETAPAWLGFDIEPGDHLCVARVVPGSPAAKAGIVPGDCIVSVAGDKVVNQDQYRAARLGLAPWAATELQVERKGRTRKLEVEPWERDVGLLYERLGLQVDLQVFARGSWLRISAVRPDSPAHALGLQPGDLIDAVKPNLRGWRRGVTFDSREDFAGFITTLPEATELEIEILRDLDHDGSYISPDELMRGSLKAE